MWELEAFITPTMVGGELAGAGAIHGMVTAGTLIGVIQVSTRIADTTTTDMTVTTDTVGITGLTDNREGNLRMVVVDTPRLEGLGQLPDRVEIRTAGFLPQADLLLEPQRLSHNWRQILQAPGNSPVVTQATLWLAPAEWRRRPVATRY